MYSKFKPLGILKFHMNVNNYWLYCVMGTRSHSAYSLVSAGYHRGYVLSNSYMPISVVQMQ